MTSNGDIAIIISSDLSVLLVLVVQHLLWCAWRKPRSRMKYMSACLLLLLLTYATACLPLPPSAYAAMLLAQHPSPLLPTQHSSTLETGYNRRWESALNDPKKPDSSKTVPGWRDNGHNRTKKTKELREKWWIWKTHLSRQIAIELSQKKGCFSEESTFETIRGCNSIELFLECNDIGLEEEHRPIFVLNGVDIKGPLEAWKGRSNSRPNLCVFLG